MAIDFSKKALSNLSANTQLHVLTKLNASYSIFFLIFTTIVMIVVLFWAFFGRITESINSPAITLLSDGVTPIVSKSSGTLKYLNISPGVKVETGQVIGQIYNPQTISEIKKIQAQYKSLEQEIAILKEGNEKLTQFRLEQENKKSDAIENFNKEIDKNKEQLKQLISLYQKILNKGDDFKLKYYQVIDQSLLTKQSELSLKLNNIDSESLLQDLIWQGQEKLIELNQRLEEKERANKFAEFLFKEAFWLTSPTSGKVIEIFKEHGGYVENGERIALVASDHRDGIYLVAFVSAEDGKKIKNGMRAFFAPSGVRPEKYGYVKAVVRDVSDAPINFDAVMAELVNDSLAKQLAGKNAVTRVEFELIPDANTKSGYAWTSKYGGNKKLLNGVYGKVIINVEYRSPISYIIPALRKVFISKDREKEEGIVNAL